MAGDTILLVEDSEDDAFAFRRALKKAGVTHRVEVASDGRQALDYLLQVITGGDADRFPPPAIVFLDLKLPYHDGMEILEWIRRQAALSQLKVIVLSGSDEPRDRERAKSLGARGYLVKPATPDDLRRALEMDVDNAGTAS